MPPNSLDQDRIAVPDMSIVLVCWNNKNYLERCLVSLYQGDLHSRFDVVVIDNGSTDGSQTMLWDKFPQVKIIQNGFNAGLGRASNQGIEATKGRYILLLNNDTLVNGPSLDAMVKFLDDHPDGGAAGGRLLNPDETLQAGYNHFSSLWEEFLIATRLGSLLRSVYPSHRANGLAKRVGWISSACLLVRREALDQIGLLDEEYFIYGDEADLQYRLQQAGWSVYYLPSAYTIHFGGRSMNRWSRRKMVYRGKMLFYKKNYGSFRTWILRLILGMVSLAKMIIWAMIFIVPVWRERAQKELRSNLEIVNLCLRLL
jgi:GT2 family glycosyltransferase